jgi:hypothetical protein
MHFLKLTYNKMPQCQFPIFCCFCVSEKLHRKYSQNWTKQKLNLLLFNKASRRPKRRWRGATGRPHSRAAWSSPWPCPLCVRPPWSTSDNAPSPIKTPWWKNLKAQSIFQKHIVIRRRRRPKIGRVQKLFSAPCRRGESPSEVFFIAILAFGAMSE